MSLIKNIARTLLLATVFNFIGYWIAKWVIHLNLAVKVHTEFGIKYTTIGSHVAIALIATIYAVVYGWWDKDE